MASKIETLVRSVRGLTEDRRFSTLKDPKGLLVFSDIKLRTYQANPYLENLDEPCQLIGVKDGVVVGRRNSFPSRVVANGVVYNTRISGSVYVDPQCRSSLYAISLLKKAQEFPGGDLNINCGLSLQNQKFYRLLGSAMFELVMFDAGGRWNAFHKEGEYTGCKRWAAKAINLVVPILNRLFDSRRWNGVPSWEVRSESSSNEAFLMKAARLVAADSHRYRVEITPEWLRWVLENDFISLSCQKKIYGVYEDGRLVGFAVVRIDARVKFCKVIEWQVASSFQDQEVDFLRSIAKTIWRPGYRIQIAVSKDDEALYSGLLKWFPIVARNYAVITLAEKSRFGLCEGIREPGNWRIRPGMGDSPFW